MFFYILIYLLFLFGLSKDVNSNKSNTLFYFIFVTASFFVGLRDMIGGYDVYIYAEVYESSRSFLMAFDKMEIGFRIFYYILKYVSNDRYFMFLLMAFLIFSFQFYTIKKYSPLIYFSIFLFFCKFFLMSFVYLRQGLAMGIVTLAIPYALRKKYLYIFIIMSIAFFIHKSSIIVVPLLLVINIELKKTQIFSMFVIVLIIAFTPLNQVLFGFLLDSFESGDKTSYISKTSSVNVFYFLEILVILFFSLKFQKEFYKTKVSKMVFNGLIFYVLVTLLSIRNGTFIRFSWYFLIFLFLGIPYYVNFIKSIKLKKLSKVMFVVYFSLLFFRLLILYDGGDFMPYKTIFNDFDRNGMWEFREYR
jgi:hypothetical protein